MFHKIEAREILLLIFIASKHFAFKADPIKQCIENVESERFVFIEEYLFLIRNAKMGCRRR